MKRIYLALFCGFLGMILMGAAIPSQVNGQVEISNANLVTALRLLNTQEYTYQHDNGRFATQQEMLSFLRTKGILSKSHHHKPRWKALPNYPEAVSRPERQERGVQNSSF